MWTEEQARRYGLSVPPHPKPPPSNPPPSNVKMVPVVKFTSSADGSALPPSLSLILVLALTITQVLVKAAIDAKRAQKGLAELEKEMDTLTTQKVAATLTLGAENAKLKKAVASGDKVSSFAGQSEHEFLYHASLYPVSPHQLHDLAQLSVSRRCPLRCRLLEA